MVTDGDSDTEVTRTYTFELNTRTASMCLGRLIRFDRIFWEYGW